MIFQVASNRKMCNLNIAHRNTVYSVLMDVQTSEPHHQGAIDQNSKKAEKNGQSLRVSAKYEKSDSFDLFNAWRSAWLAYARCLIAALTFVRFVHRISPQQNRSCFRLSNRVSTFCVTMCLEHGIIWHRSFQDTDIP